MTIEERIESALDDLEGLIAEGEAPAEALKIAAEPYGIKPEVLKVRAAPMGDFDGYVQRILEAKERVGARHAIIQVAQAFRRPSGTEADKVEALRAAVASALGREPTELEMSFAKQAVTDIGRARSDEFLAEVLAKLRSGPPRLHTD